MMSFRLGPPLIPGAFHLGFRGYGPLGSTFPSTGTSGPSFGYKSIAPADLDAEVCFVITRFPTKGTFQADEDTTFTYSGLSDSFDFKKLVWGVDGGSASATMTIGGESATVTKVTVTPASITLSGFAMQQFSATVDGTNGPSQLVTWSTESGTINSSGFFIAPAATTSVQSITITATSAVDGSKKGTATVTIAALGESKSAWSSAAYRRRRRK